MEEKEVILSPEQAHKYMQLLAYENYKFEQAYREKCYKKWRKDGMWNAIKTGKIVENTKKKREMLNDLQNR